MRFRAFIFELEDVLVNTSLLPARQEVLSVDPSQADLSVEFLNEGAEELLLQLKRQRLKVAVVSTGRHSSQILNRLGLSSFIDRVIGFDEHRTSESGGNAFMNAAAQLQINVRRCVGMAGTAPGLANVKAANMYAIGIGSPDNMGAADVTYAHLRDVILNDL
jgi:beta-phosphoglucomutase